MTIKRTIAQLKFWAYIGNGHKRAEYAKRKGIFAQIGDNCYLPTKLPLYPQLVRLHNNIVLHRSVKLITHDRINAFLKRIPGAYQYKMPEVLGPIEIMDNVYVGMNTIIMPNVKIGPNVIISSGSVVTGDIPENSIVSGVPAKIVGNFDAYCKIRVLSERMSTFEFKRSRNECIDEKTVQLAWSQFDSRKHH